NGYLLTVSVGDPGKYFGILLDRIGRVTRQRDLGLAYFASAAPYDGGFVISGCEVFSPCSARLWTLSNTGTLTKHAIPGLPQFPLYAMRASDDRLMITWYEKTGLAHFMILGFGGNVLKPPFTFPIPDEASPSGLLWDGKEFLLLIREYMPLIGKLWAIRLNGSGDRLDEPYLLSE